MDTIASPQQIANYFLDEAERENIPITTMKLVKLVYIAYGWYIALTGKRLFDEPVEAWNHGPVIPSLYHEFKEHGRNPIDVRSYDLDYNLETGDPECSVPRINPNDKDIALILGRVWVSYRRFSAWDLSKKTHEPETPWAKVYEDGHKGTKLNDEHVKLYYQDKIRTYLAQN